MVGTVELLGLFTVAALHFHGAVYEDAAVLDRLIIPTVVHRSCRGPRGAAVGACDRRGRR